MTDHTPDEETLAADEAALARLADGSLAPAQRDALAARVAREPELQARLRDQQNGLSLIQATDQIVAPAGLRASVAELTESSDGRGRQQGRAEARRIALWRPRASIGLVALAVALIAVVSVALHGANAPTVGGTTRLALAAATGPAPSVSVSDQDRLAVQGAGIPFPSYVRSTGWRASGVRHDTLDGRRVTTVFYGAGGARVGYSIVSGAALMMPRGPVVTGPGGVRYAFIASDGAQVITWRRDGHTCVIAGRSVTRRTLLGLAVADEQV